MDSATNKAEPNCKETPTSDSCESNDGTCTTTPILNAVGVSGSASTDATSKIVTVKLDDTPKNTNGKLYFKCTKTPSNTCVVTVNMPAPLKGSKPSAPNSPWTECGSAGCWKQLSSPYRAVLRGWWACCAVFVFRSMQFR